MTAKLIRKSKELGFAEAGVAKAGLSETWPFFQGWLDRGLHGGMGWLAEGAELRRRLDSLLPGARSVLAVSLSYAQPLPLVPGAPRIARYAQGRDYHRVIRGRLRKLGEWLRRGEEGKAWRVAVDSAPILEREWAQRAGLGWPGKNTCLIHSRKGSWFLLGFLVTTLDLEPTAPTEGGCGSCRLCIDECPTGAIVFEEGRWQVDSRQCISYWTIEHKGDIPGEIARRMGPWTFGCDICQEVCPFNQARPSQPERASVTGDRDMLGGDRRWPHLEQLVQISEEEWDILTRGSPVRRAGWEGLKRNAAISLEWWDRQEKGS